MLVVFVVYVVLGGAVVATRKKKKEPRIICIANQKGGIGKTSSVLNIGAALQISKRKVLLIDLDTQGDLSYSLGYQEPDQSLWDVCDKGVKIEELIQHAENGLDIIPAALDLANLEMKEWTYRDELLKLPYDYIIYDCPPSMLGCTRAAIEISDEIIIPTTADENSFRGVRGIVRSVRDLQEAGKTQIQIGGVLITRYHSRIVADSVIKDDLVELSKTLDVPIYKTIIRANVAVREADIMQKTVFEHDARSAAARDYKALAAEIEKERF